MLVNSDGTKIINTEYLDGFQYSTPNTEPIRKALETKDDGTMEVTKAGEEEAFSPLEGRELVLKPGDPQDVAPVLSFFPTAEGYYDYENFRYIYQYKDHLGNVRVSYVKNGNDLQIMDRNDYYPFGMSFLKPFGQVSVYDPMAIPYNYKYNGKELQETGFYSFKWRNYMSDVGRFFNIDPLSEKYAYQSHYNFAENRVIDGRELEGLEWVKSTTLNDNGTKTYTISANINLINKSQNLSSEGVESFKSSFVSQMKESFEGNMGNGDNMVLGNINFTDEAGAYTMAIVDKLSIGDSLPNGTDGKGYTYGEKGNSQNNYMETVNSGDDTAAFATHEVGHSFGLKHQTDNSNGIKDKIKTDNLMFAPQFKISTETIPEQKQIIIQNIPDAKEKK